ncbi:MAG: FkbM family methyltransferase, partial [Paraglaciecola sp.]|nr:FkbM family methyltransferase [Paraglaciecola sp.]
MKTNESGLATFPFLLNWLYCQAQTHDFPGKYRLFLWSVRVFKGRSIKYRINGKSFFVPVEEWCFWLEKGPTNYYPQDIQPFVAAINHSPEKMLMIDCGADIGAVSMMVASGTDNIARYVCIEPNPSAFALLEANQSVFKAKADLVNKAVSNFCGSATLHCDANITSDHDAYIQVDSDGVTEVTTLDKLGTTLGFSDAKYIALKIDVEGQEPAVFEGARHLLLNSE